MLIQRQRDMDGNGSLSASEETLFALHDAQGSITAITNTSGTIVQQFIYDIDGGMVALTDGSVDHHWIIRFDWRLLWRQMRQTQTKTQAVSSNNSRGQSKVSGTYISQVQSTKVPDTFSGPASIGPVAFSCSVGGSGDPSISVRIDPAPH